MRASSERLITLFRARWALMLAVAMGLAACGATPSGAPTVRQVEKDIESSTTLAFVPATIDQVARLEQLRTKGEPSAPFFPANEGSYALLGAGDTLSISVLEKASGGLFSQSAQVGTGASGSNLTRLPEMQIDAAGQIDFPYIGVLRVSGLTELALGKLLASQLSELTPSPNVMVKRIEDRSNAVLVLGEVRQPGEISLTPARESILQAIAGAGGNTRAPSDTVVRLTRAGVSRTIRLSNLIENPDRDILLRRGDRLFLESDPQTFTILGASGVQSTSPLPSSGVTLTEALGSARGLDDNRADSAGVFVLRHESNDTLRKLGITPPREGKTSPTVFQFDLGHVEGTFAANDFHLAAGDVVLVANATSVEVRKILAIFSDATNVATDAVTLAGAL